MNKIPDLTKEQKKEELVKISCDFRHFLRYVKIQEPGNLAVEFEFWPNLLHFAWWLLRFQLIDLIKSKQIGISWILAAFALWKIMTLPGWNVLEISQGDSYAKALLAKSKTIYENLPEWIRKIPHYAYLEPNSLESFGFKLLKSKITAFPSTETSGIGETAGLVIHDESDFHDYYEVNLSHTRATVADNPQRQLISVSTVDKYKPDSYFKRHWKAGEGSGYPEQGTNGFKSLFYGYDVRPGRDEKWYQAICEENRDTPWVVKGNYPRTVQEALEPLAATSCFNADVLKRLWDDSGYGETREGFIHILHPFVVGTSYVAGIDVGEGVGLDYSSLSIVGKRGLSAEVVAVIYSNQVGTDSFAFECDRLCREYHNPLLVVDNIGVGRAVIDKLIELVYPNLYWTKDKEGNKKKAGWALSAHSKNNNKRELVVKLVENVNNSSLLTFFRPQVQELMEYQWINGYPEPTGKTHGDTVISLMLANIVLDKVGTPQKASFYVDGVKRW